MKRLLVLSLFLSVFINAEAIDVVHLKNGSMIKGTIIEQIPNESIKIETSDGSIFVYDFDQISKISIEHIDKRNEYSYNNMIGGLYIRISNTNIYALNSLDRIKDNVSAGFMFSTSYGNTSLPGQIYQFMPYIAFDLFKSKYITPLLIVGGKYSIREWESTSMDASGTITHFGLLFGGAINLKLNNKIGFGIIAAMAENYYFSAYNDGTSVITDTEYEFYPAFTINIYDILPIKK